MRRAKVNVVGGSAQQGQRRFVGQAHCGRGGQPFTGLRQGQARPIVPNGIGVFAEVGGRVQCGEAMKEKLSWFRIDCSQI